LIVLIAATSVGAMPDDTSALSTIPPSLPADAEYEAMHAAIMATVRGRWFLAEYARRKRYADTRLLLDAMERIEGVIRTGQARDAGQSVRIELLEMARTIAQTRADVAEIKPDAPGDGKPAEPADDAAADAVAAAERLQDMTWTMRERGFNMSTCDQISELAGIILGASSVRAPGDQRAHKLGEALKYLEQRVDAMLETTGHAPAAAAKSEIHQRATNESSTNGSATDGSDAAADPAPASACDQPASLTIPVLSAGGHTIDRGQGFNRGEDPDRGQDPLADVAAAMAALLSPHDGTPAAAAEPTRSEPTAADPAAAALRQPELEGRATASPSLLGLDVPQQPGAAHPHAEPLRGLASTESEPADFLLEPEPASSVLADNVARDAGPAPAAATASTDNGTLAALAAISDAERIALFT
jgi:hypothetical protein